MLINLAIFLWVAGRYQYKTVARKREAPPHRRPQWLQPQVVDGVRIPVRHRHCTSQGLTITSDC